MSRPARRPDCHPDRLHVAHGLCRPCYLVQWRRRHPRKQDPEYHRRWYEAHRDDILASRARYKAAHRDEIRASQRRHYLENRDRLLVYHSAHRRERDTGVSPEMFRQIWEEQRGLCAICEHPLELKRTHADHDHQTGLPRGLLHGKCNTGIGSLGDDPQVLRRAADYIESRRRPALVVVA